MTEKQWLACKGPRRVLDFWGSKASNRQLRLFAVAYCRLQTSQLYQERSERLMELAERYAEGLATRGELKRARQIAYPMGFISTLEPQAVEGASSIVSHASNEVGERAKQAALLRDIIGNPFRPVRVDRSWLTWNERTVPKIAQSIYDDRRFEDLPILADSLEEAGCTDEQVLEHCRGPSLHVRGCWVVDLILGKS
jgi:hypothetical protein